MNAIQVYETQGHQSWIKGYIQYMCGRLLPPEGSRQHYVTLVAKCIILVRNVSQLFSYTVV